MRKPLPFAPYCGYGRLVPSFMVCSVDTNFHVPTIRSRISDSVWAQIDELQSARANRMNTEFFMGNSSSRVKCEPSRDGLLSPITCSLGTGAPRPGVPRFAVLQNPGAPPTNLCLGYTTASS